MWLADLFEFTIYYLHSSDDSTENSLHQYCFNSSSTYLLLQNACARISGVFNCIAFFGKNDILKVSISEDSPRP
jgi:hypothetical protein